jgi:molecular chaperone GrpE
MKDDNKRISRILDTINPSDTEPEIVLSKPPQRPQFAQQPPKAVQPVKGTSPQKPLAGSTSKPQMNTSQNSMPVQKVVAGGAPPVQPMAPPKPVEPVRVEAPVAPQPQPITVEPPKVVVPPPPKPEPVAVQQPVAPPVAPPPPQPQPTPQPAQPAVPGAGAEIEKLRLENDDLRGIAQRIQADFENYKRRNKAIATDMYNEGIHDTIKALMPVLDTFDFALANESTTEKEREGLLLISKQFSECLTKFAVMPVGAVGDNFDPTLHNAVMQVDAGKEKSGKLVLVLQKGYKMGDKILRYAMVQVGA